MPEIHDPVGGLSGAPEIRVDLGQVDRFADAVQSELDGNLTPAAIRLAAVYRPGANFGLLHQSPDVQAARDKHDECLRAATAQLESYIRASKVLIEAAQTVAAGYRDTDATAAGSFDAEQVLWDAAIRAQAAQSDLAAPDLPDTRQAGPR
jgi:hypothetical protein